MNVIVRALLFLRLMRPSSMDGCWSLIRRLKHEASVSGPSAAGPSNIRAVTPRARPYRLAAAGVIVWFVCTIVFWAARSPSDAVPVGVDNSISPAAAVSVSVRCNSLFSGAARPAGALPALNAQPADQPALAFSRPPCVVKHHEARRLFVFDVLFLLAALAGLIWIMRRLGDDDDPVARSVPRSSPAT